MGVECNIYSYYIMTEKHVQKMHKVKSLQNGHNFPGD